MSKIIDTMYEVCSNEFLTTDSSFYSWGKGDCSDVSALLIMLKYKIESEYHESKTKDLQQELTKLKNEAYYMRYHIHQQGFYGWCPKQKEKMKSIVYDENDKVKST